MNFAMFDFMEYHFIKFDFTKFNLIKFDFASWFTFTVQRREGRGFICRQSAYSWRSTHRCEPLLFFFILVMHVRTESMGEAENGGDLFVWPTSDAL